jgi:hypothetical protein
MFSRLISVAGVRPVLVHPRGRRENVVRTTEEEKRLQSETVTKLRSLSHDLSNYIETIMQASYLLGQAKLDDNNKKWLEMVDKAAQDAARINREIREILRAQN